MREDVCFQFIESCNELFPYANLDLVGAPRIAPSLKLSALNNSMLCELQADNIEFSIEQMRDEVIIDFPIASSYETEHLGSTYRVEQGSLYIRCNQNKATTSTNNSRVLTLKVRQSDLLQKHWNDSNSNNVAAAHKLENPAAAKLFRVVAHCWATTNSKNFLKSELAVAELEDALLTATDLLMADTLLPSKDINSAPAAKVSSVAEYISANLDKPITRTHLQQLSDVPIRSLSRGFEQRYGVGPIDFLKQRRLEAAYHALYSANKDSTKVIDVAIKYGFNHIGRFSEYFKQAFGESPSVTLSRDWA